MGSCRQRAWRPRLLAMSIMLSGNAFFFRLTQRCFTLLPERCRCGGDMACMHSER